MGSTISKELLFIAEKNCVVVIPYLQWRTHEGELFSVEYYDDNVDDDDYLDILITTHADYELHAVIGVIPEAAENLIFLYENPVNVTGGIALTAYDFNRTKSNSCHATFHSAPTVVDTGTVALISSRYNKGGSSRGSFTLTAINADQERILKKDEQYLLRVKNISGSDDKLCSAIIEFYEVAA